MDAKIIEHLKEFLSKNDIDGILVNSDILNGRLRSEVKKG